MDNQYIKELEALEEKAGITVSETNPPTRKKKEVKKVKTKTIAELIEEGKNANPIL